MISENYDNMQLHKFMHTSSMCRYHEHDYFQDGVENILLYIGKIVIWWYFFNIGIHTINTINKWFGKELLMMPLDIFQATFELHVESWHIFTEFVD